LINIVKPYLSIVKVPVHLPQALIEANVVRIVKQQLVEVFWGHDIRFVVGPVGMVTLDFVARRYNIVVESVQKETASLQKRDCRARATHPGAVDYIITKPVAFI